MGDIGQEFMESARALHAENLRDQFAMAVVSGVVSRRMVSSETDAKEIAGISYMVADAMLKARAV